MNAHVLCISYVCIHVYVCMHVAYASGRQEVNLRRNSINFEFSSDIVGMNLSTAFFNFSEVGLLPTTLMINFHLVKLRSQSAVIAVAIRLFVRLSN